MVSAIGSPTTSGLAPILSSSTAGIEAQVSRYKKELSDCVNCSSARTSEGKAAIAAAASKVSIAEARIEKITASNQSSTPDATTTTTNHDSRTQAYAGTLTYQAAVGIESSSASRLSDASAGTHVNVFA